MWMRRLVIIGCVVSWSMGSLLSGVAQEPRFSAAIHQGDCEDLRDAVATLTPPVLATGPQRGNAAALPAASSATAVPIAFDALRTGEHALVLSSAEADTALACGEIGGALTETGALIIGLHAEQSGGVI